MIEFSFEILRRLGLTPAMAQALATTDVATNTQAEINRQWMRATAVHRETVEVHDGVQQRSARCAARLTRDLIDAGSAQAVGDWVQSAQDEHQQRWVTALLVMGLDMDFNLQRLERYLALVASSGVLPVVVLTKADVALEAAPDSVQQCIQDVRGRVGQHVEVVAVDGRIAEASTRLHPYLSAGQTLVLLGSSGAGKSTLTNSLLGGAKQDTGAVREHDSRGKHTTTARSLHLLPTGACVIDTPGVRTLRPDVDSDALGQLFADISTLARACRFRDCQHQDEPGCAVRAQVDPARLKNFHKMLRESRRDSMGALERQSQLAQWKVRSRAGRQRLESKRVGPAS